MDKCQALATVIDDAHNASLSLTFFDSIDGMIDYSPLEPRFSNIVLQTLVILTNRVPPKGRMLFILGTACCVEVMEKLNYIQ